MPTSTSFSLAKHASLRRLAGQLQRQFSLTPGGQHRSRWELYDSADGRLLSAGRVLVWETRELDGQLCLRELRNGRLLAMAPLPDPPPSLAAELPSGGLSAELQRLLGDCRLLPLGLAQVRRLHFDARDEEDKTIARLFAEEYRMPGSNMAYAAVVAKQLVLEPLRGYEKAARHIERRIKIDFALEPARSHMLEQILGCLNQRSSKGPRQRKPVADNARPADVAVRQVLLWLLSRMEANEAGILAGVDSEFVHDFRVAVRTTRVIVRQLMPMLAKHLRTRILADFAWLGTLAGANRDLDVALIALADYRASLPASESRGLGSLVAYLYTRREHEHEIFRAALASERYRRLKIQWRRFCARNPGQGSAVQAAGADASDHSSAKPIGTVIRRRSADLYKRVLREGSALDADSAGATFHDLRKSCKKLSYLLALFRELYAIDELEPLSRKLKRLQRNLGKQQDIEVEMALIGHFKNDAARVGPLPEPEAVAIARLLESYAQRKAELRADFSACFRAIKRDKTRKRFRTLFGTGQH